MLLYLMRHALAEPGGPGQPDLSRKLTTEGVGIAAGAVWAFANGRSEPERLFSSPYVRARQTADIVSSALGLPVEEDRRIEPGFSIESLDDLHREAGRPASMMVVGHEPDMGRVVYALTGSVLDVRQATLMVVESGFPANRRGTLRGVYDPDVMASIGSALRLP